MKLQFCTSVPVRSKGQKVLAYSPLCLCSSFQLAHTCPSPRNDRAHVPLSCPKGPRRSISELPWHHANARAHARTYTSSHARTHIPPLPHAASHRRSHAHTRMATPRSYSHVHARPRPYTHGHAHSHGHTFLWTLVKVLIIDKKYLLQSVPTGTVQVSPRSSRV